MPFIPNSPQRRSRFLLYFFLPVALAMAVGAAYSFFVTSQSREVQRAANAEQASQKTGRHAQQGELKDYQGFENHGVLDLLEKLSGQQRKVAARGRDGA